MKKLLLILLFAGIFTDCFCQSVQKFEADTIRFNKRTAGDVVVDVLGFLRIKGRMIKNISNDTSSTSKDSTNLITERAAKQYADKKAADSAIYLTHTQGDNLYVRIQTQNPTAGLTGGVNQELLPSGAALSYTLNWNAGRLGAGTGINATANLSSIVVATISQTFSNPSAPGTVTGTQSISVTRNTTTSFNITVTTSDGKTAVASSSFNFYPKCYIGTCSGATPTSTEILAAITQPLSTSRTTTVNINGAGNYVFYAYYAPYGTATIRTDLVSDASGSFNYTTYSSFTTGTGALINLNIYTTKQQQGGSTGNIYFQ